MKIIAVFLCIAVSSALAAHRGCWRDDAARVMVKSTMNSINDQTVQKCIHRCKGMRFPFAGVQWRRECFCGFDFTRLGKANNCNLKCTGNQRQICGGDWALNVYDTDYADATFRNGYGDFRVFKNKVNAGTAEARCKRLGQGWDLAYIPNVGVLNAVRPKMATLGYPVTTELWIGQRTPKPHHAKLSDAELGNDSGAQCRIISNWPGQSFPWNIYSKRGNDGRFYICQKFKPVSLGCWKDDPQRVMVKSTMQSINNQSTKQCLFRCLTMGYPYAGTQYARECFCGRDFTRKGRANNCNMKCTGSNEKCGGTWALSVYKTGLRTPCELIGN